MPAHAGAEAVFPAQEFAKERDQIQPPRDQRRRAPVIQRHGILLTEMADHAGRDRFLSDAQMHFAGDHAFLPEILHGFLEAPAPQHLPVKRPQIRFHGVYPVRLLSITARHLALHVNIQQFGGQ